MLFLTRLSHVAFDALIRSGIRATNSAKTDMCKELKCRILKLVPGIANAGPAKQSGDQVQVSAWKEFLSTAVSVLKQGNVVAVPTDTVYGLACLAQNSEAIQRIYETKGRNGNKPLAICVGAVEDIYKYCKVTVPDQLLRDLLLGPVTLVLEQSDELNKDLNPFTQLVGVRIPDHAFMQVLAQKCEEPLALTSANVSSQASTLTVDEFRDLLPQLALVIDGGPIRDVLSPECRLGSTVINLSTPGQYSIIRPGCALTATVEILENKYSLLLETPDH